LAAAIRPSTPTAPPDCATSSTKTTSPYPQNADAAWWESHNYVWEPDRLKKHIGLLDPTKPVFLCGNAGNIDKVWSIFKTVFYLDTPPDVMAGRIASGRRDHSFGQRVEEREQLIRWAEPFKIEMLGLGAVTIDATKSVNKVVDSILKRVKDEATA